MKVAIIAVLMTLQLPLIARAGGGQPPSSRVKVLSRAALPGPEASRLTAVGVKPGDVHLWGRTSTTNRKGYEWLRSQGFTTHGSQVRPGVVLEILATHGGNGFVIRDDAGDLIAAAARAVGKGGAAPGIVAVALTPTAIARFQGKVMPFPVYAARREGAQVVMERIDRSSAGSSTNPLDLGPLLPILRSPGQEIDIRR